MLVKYFGVLEMSPTPRAPGVGVVDVLQLFYHIVWLLRPYHFHVKDRLSHYPDGIENIIVFDKCQYVSVRKYHARKRRGGEVIINNSSPSPVLCPKEMQS